MALENLLQLANDLEWLGCELEAIGRCHAMEGYPHAGSSWQEFREKQKGVLFTCEKIEHELKNTVRFDAEKLVGIAFPLEGAFNAITSLLEAVEQIKYITVYQVQELPEAVRAFKRLIHAEFAGATEFSASEG